MLRSEEEDVWQEQPDPNPLNKTLELQEELITNFKTLWYENYLSLREHGRNIYQYKWENGIEVGDLVLIKCINKSIPFWMLTIKYEPSNLSKVMGQYSITQFPTYTQRKYPVPKMILK